jgi:hypothetical protein
LLRQWNRKSRRVPGYPAIGAHWHLIPGDVIKARLPLPQQI